MKRGLGEEFQKYRLMLFFFDSLAGYFYDDLAKIVTNTMPLPIPCYNIGAT